MSAEKEAKLSHFRADSGVSGFSINRPRSAPVAENSFTAKEFSDYEKRLSQETIADLAAANLQYRLQGREIPRSASMSTYSNRFTAKDFATYEKRLRSTIHASAPALEAGTFSNDEVADELAIAVTLPDKRQPTVVRNLRHKILSVYRRIATLIIIGNLIALICFVSSAGSLQNISADYIATATSVNFFLTIAVRQEWIVNLLYATCLSIPLGAPLRLRRILAKVYENGGFHSGTAYAGTAWFTLLCAVLTRMYMHGNLANTTATLTVGYFLLAVLAIILVFALPHMRMRWHNAFEFTHRFLGWMAVAFLWALLFLLVESIRIATGVSFGNILVREAAFWFLIGITLMIIAPWVRLRKVRFTAENLSDHAVRLNFNEKLFPIRGVAIADSPLGQYHSFATFPNPHSSEPNGQSIIVSKAGDWTAEQVGNKNADRHYWLRGVPKTGVLAMSLIFRRVVIVTTGSGIGPCLAFLNLPENLRRPCRVLWSSPRPAAIYDKEICDSVKVCDPNALIWDSKAMGRPDMVQLTYNLYRESDAEAVFVISNPGLTRKLVYAMESRGIPAFGPIWDS